MRLIDADELIKNEFKNDISYKAFVNIVKRQPTIGECKKGEWLHEYLQTAVDFGIITETQASRLIDMIDDSEDNT